MKRASTEKYLSLQPGVFQDPREKTGRQIFIWIGRSCESSRENDQKLTIERYAERRENVHVQGEKNRPRFDCQRRNRAPNFSGSQAEGPANVCFRGRPNFLGKFSSSAGKRGSLVSRPNISLPLPSFSLVFDREQYARAG